MEQDVPTSFAAKSEPWIQATFAGFGQGIRRSECERLVLWINYVPAGVVSAKQHTFTIEQVTQLCHSLPRNSCAVVLLPNRAGDLRGGSPQKQLC